MRAFSALALILAALCPALLEYPASALELPWEKEGGSVSPQMPGQQKPAGVGAPTSGAQTGQRFAILLGVGKFRDVKIPSLEYARSDAETVHEYLTRSCWSNSANVYLYVDEDARLSQVSGAMQRIAERAGAGDLVLVYVSTHTTPGRFGGPSYILHDSAFSSDGGRLQATLSLEALGQFLRRLGQATAIVIIDSGASERLVGRILGIERVYKADMARSAPPERPAAPVRVVVGNAAGVSFESDDLKGSFMTHFLLEGLKKFNGDLESAVVYARPIVDRMVREEKKIDKGQDVAMFSNVPRVGVRLCE